MSYQGVVVRGRFTPFVVLLGILFINSLSGFAASVTLAWDPSPDPTVVGYRVYYGGASGNYTNSYPVGTVTTASISNLVVGSTYYFAATAFDGNGVESDYSNETLFTPVAPPNQAPTLNALANVTISEGAALQTVNLSGISSGATNETQTLAVTATSSNPALIPNPTVNYTSPNSTGAISFAPVALAFGTATLTVQVNDGGASNNVVTRTFTVTVNPVNQAPTLNTLANVTINEGAGLQTVNLSGISSGAANETQTLSVTASSSNPGLIPNPTVSYTSPNSAGTLSFTPVALASGSATVTVQVNDGGASNNVVTQTFTVTVNPVNQAPTLNALANVTINEGAGQQTVNLSGISSGATNEVQTLAVTATSSNPGLIPNPTVNYTSPNGTGTLSFTPVALASGSATVTVQVNDGGASNNIVTRTFTVTVNSVNQAPTLNALANVTINEGAGLQTVNLSGISSGATNELQTLTVTASSSNPALIPNPTVSYTSPGATGTISFTPVAFAFGTATVTVQVNDGGASNNVVTQTFTVTVNPVNQAPTLSALANVTINEGAGLQTVNLSGISSGAANETQTLSVTATSSNPALIPNPTVSYTSPNSTGAISFTPLALAFGTATVSVQVNDGGASNNVVTQTFTVTVNPVNQSPTLSALANMTINEGAGLQTVDLSGISSGATNEAQTLSVTATSSNPGLIPNPTVNYTSPNSAGTLSFTSVAGGGGSATITVTVNDGGAQNNTVVRTFTVTVNRLPVISAIPNQTNTVGLVVTPIAFTISDTETAAGSLAVSASSDNQGLVRDADIVIGGTGGNRTVLLTPLADQTGVAQITVVVSDGQGSTQRSFLFAVKPKPLAPTNLRVAQVIP